MDKDKQLFFNIGHYINDLPSSNVVKAGEEYLALGSDSKYYIHCDEFYKSVPVLRSLIDGASLLASDCYTTDVDIYKIYQYLFTYGQCPLLVRQSRDKSQYWLNALDPRFVRTNDNETSYIYSETEGFKKRVVYPRFPQVEGSSILMLKLNDLESPYSLPIWSSAFASAEILSSVATYHRNSLSQGFSPTTLINFNNGTPAPEEKARIEAMVKDKFCGSEGQKIMVAFNDTPDTAATIQSITNDDTSTRYHDLVESCKSELYTAFRATPSLFGCPEGAANALSDSEYQSQYNLFLKFTLKPIIRMVDRALLPFGIRSDISKLDISLDSSNTLSGNE